MKSYEEIRKQLNGLVNGIRECNFITNENKKDIVQEAWAKILEKMEQGILVDDYDKIKGYTFLVLRNLCAAHHRYSERVPNIDLKWDLKDEQDDSNKEYQEHCRNLLKERMQGLEVSNIMKRFFKDVMEGKSDEELKDEWNVNGWDLGQLKRKLYWVVKKEIKKKPKYYLTSLVDSEVKVPIYTDNELKRFFKDYNHNKVMSSISKKQPLNGYIIIRNHE